MQDWNETGVALQGWNGVGGAWFDITIRIYIISNSPCIQEAADNGLGSYNNVFTVDRKAFDAYYETWELISPKKGMLPANLGYPAASWLPEASYQHDGRRVVGAKYACHVGAGSGRIRVYLCFDEVIVVYIENWVKFSLVYNAGAKVIQAHCYVYKSDMIVSESIKYTL